VLTVAFNPDGKDLASGFGDATVRFLDINTQTPLFACKGFVTYSLYVPITISFYLMKISRISIDISLYFMQVMTVRFSLWHGR